MSFLRTFRSNLILSTAPPPSNGTVRGAIHSGTSSSSKAATALAKANSSGSRKNSTSSRTITEQSDRPYNTGRRSSSNSVGTMQNRSAMKLGAAASSSRYGKENPAPIVVYLDKQPDGKKQQPTSILRTNTFTRHDEEPERVRNAITRSDTFTINETNEEPIDTGTYTRPAKVPMPTTDVFEPLYAKNISLHSHEKLPTVVDSRTYRKKSFKSSKPVQKVESFIKRFERTLFSKGGNNNGSESRRHGSRKGSTASEATIVPAPRFRDVGINCKLDEEEKFKAKLEAIKKSRQNSRDSLTSYRERSLSPGKQKFVTTGTYDRRSSSSLSVQPLKEDANSYNSDRDSITPPSVAPGNRSTFFQPTESSILKSKQKEIEMGYSVVNKRQPAFYLTNMSTGQQRSPDRGKTKSESDHLWRSGRDAVEDRSFNNIRERRYSQDNASAIRRDTYQTLKDNYERQQQLQAPAIKPVGIASPRMSAVRPADVPLTTPPSPLAARKEPHPELPKYTFGTELQQRRNRFQQFQKSFKKMDDSASEVSVQQSFFVPI
uniref:Uncharacterized protein n=1 Tax=Anopheles minimus TaxID=112268 RepID=A0A182WAP9_9DIPT